MFKGKNALVLIVTLSLLLTIVVAVVGVTIAWYSTKTAQETGLELNANGVMVVFFDDEQIFSQTQLKPAVARKDKITENVTSFDVTTVNENVSEAATTVTVTSAFTYLNSSSENSELYGLVPADITVSVEGKLVFSDDSEKTLIVSDELNVSIVAAVDYKNTDLTDFNQNVTLNTPFEIEGDATIVFTTTMYFKNVDDLIDPDILRADHLYLYLNVLADPQVEEE